MELAILRERAKLLRESLEKSHVTTEKIVAALDSFDHRLSSLDSAIKPIQERMQGSMRCHDNANKCLKKTEFIVHQFDRLKELELVIFKGPDDDLNGFLDAMDQLLRITRFFNSRKNWKTSESIFSHANDLLTKAINLAEIKFHKIITSHSKPIAPDQLFERLPRAIKYLESISEDQTEEEKIVRELPTLSPKVILALNSIAVRLVLHGRHSKCLQIYREARANALEMSLRYLGLQRLGKEEVQKMPWESLEEKSPSWIDIMRISIKLLFTEERQLCDEVLRGIEDEFRDKCFAEVIRDSLTVLLSFLDAVVKIKRSPEKLFVLLDIYEMMCELIPEMEVLFTGEACKGMLQSVLGLQKRLIETTTKTFEGFADEVDKDASKPTPNGGFHPLSRYVMNYLKFLFDYEETLKKLLEEYGAENQDTANLQFLPAILRILQSLQNSLEAKSKNCKDHGQNFIFMATNIHYIVTSVRNTETIKRILGDDWIQRKRRIVQQNSNNYRKACWAKVYESLSTQGLLSSSSSGGPNNSPKGSLSSNALRETIKERLKLFNAQLEEIHQKHRQWKVQDEELRENLRLIIAEILLPAYRSFLQKIGPIIDASRTSKYVKYTPEDLQQLVDELFEGKNPA